MPLGLLRPDPELMVLDEPTAALDVESRHELWASVRAYAARGRTVLVCTHYLDEADEAHGVVRRVRGAGGGGLPLVQPDGLSVYGCAGQLRSDSGE
jgi:ABC-type lipoprotein export system ATPase subunit